MPPCEASFSGTVPSATKRIIFFGATKAVKRLNMNTIEMIKPTPTFHGTKCKLIARAIALLLQFTTPAVALLSWYLYDIYIAFFILILSFISIGIIRSILRNNSIPKPQQEYTYNDIAIASWFVKKEICYEHK